MFLTFWLGYLTVSCTASLIFAPPIWVAQSAAMRTGSSFRRFRVPAPRDLTSETPS